MAAIRERAEQVTGAGSGGGLQVLVEAPERLPPLPAAAEVAAYRSVQEALMNVVGHAEAQLTSGGADNAGASRRRRAQRSGGASTVGRRPIDGRSRMRCSSALQSASSTSVVAG
jgi:hypothetical protein